MKFIELTGKDGNKRLLNVAHIIKVVDGNGGAYISVIDENHYTPKKLMMK